MIAYRKSVAAQPSYNFQTASRPASWDVLVDGVVRGSIIGRVGAYSQYPSYHAVLDGQHLSGVGYGRLKDAKYAVERALKVPA